MLRKIISLGLTGLLCMAASAWAVDGSAPQAAWKSYDLDFPYMGSTSLYTCTGIESRLEQILKQLGARSDVRVSGLSCVGSQVTKTISTRIRASLPSAADGEGDKFAVKPTTVTLRSNEAGNSGAGDCELLEQLRDRALPKLGLKVVEDSLRCVPGQALGSGGALQVAALIPEKSAGQKAK